MEQTAYLGNLPRPVKISSVLWSLHSVKIPDQVFPMVKSGEARLYLSRLTGTEQIEDVHERYTLASGDLLTIVISNKTPRRRIILLV